MIQRDKIKTNSIIFLLVIPIILFGCNDTIENANNESIKKEKNEKKDFDSEAGNKRFDDVLGGHEMDIKYLDDKCLNKFQKAFTYANVWLDEAKVQEGCFFYPPKKQIRNMKYSQDDYIFFGIFFEYNNDFIYEIYSIFKPLDLFIPVHYIDDTFILDTVYHVELYFESPLKCHDITIEGSESNSLNKVGVFEKIQ
jgi:hypothetical protein